MTLGVHLQCVSNGLLTDCFSAYRTSPVTCASTTRCVGFINRETNTTIQTRRTRALVKINKMLVYRKGKYIYDALIAQNKTFIVKKISLWLREISLFIKATMTPSWSSRRHLQLDLQIKLVWKGINIYSQLYVLPSRDLTVQKLFRK